jgi:type IV pilus assembly protein PilA
MIVVAIIGILAAVAIPAYSNYTIKAKVGAAMSSLASLQTAVANCIQENGGVADSCDTTAASAVTSIPAFTATKELTAETTVLNGVITPKFATGIGSGVDGLTFTMTPSTATDQTTITWAINASSITNTTAQATLTKNSVGGVSGS